MDEWITLDRIEKFPSEGNRLEKDKKKADEINQILNEGHSSSSAAILEFRDPPRKRQRSESSTSTSSTGGQGLGLGKGLGKENAAPFNSSSASASALSSSSSSSSSSSVVTESLVVPSSWSAVGELDYIFINIYSCYYPSHE
jgi:hypothetical protein